MTVLFNHIESREMSLLIPCNHFFDSFVQMSHLVSFGVFSVIFGCRQGVVLGRSLSCETGHQPADVVIKASAIHAKASLISWRSITPLEVPTLAVFISIIPFRIGDDNTYINLDGSP